MQHDDYEAHRAEIERLSEGWISVADALPSNDRDVLIYSPNQPSDVAQRIWIAWRDRGTWWSDADDHGTPTHWRPLPDLP